MIETTREAPENIGTAFKTIIARIAQVKESAEEMDEAFDLNKAAKALRSIDISITDTNGQIRDMQEIFGDLGAVWDDLDRNTKAYMATILAGSRQQSRFLALMNDWKRTTELITISQNSAGEASRQFQTHLTGLEASMVRLTAAKEEFLMNLIDSNAYKGVIDALRMMFDLFSGMHPLLVLLIGSMTLYTTKVLLGAAAHAVKNKHLSMGIIELIAYAKLVATSTIAELGFAGALKAGIAALNAKLKILGATMAVASPYLLVLGLIALAIGAIAIKSSEAKRALETMQEQIGKKQEEATVLERQADTLEKLVEEQEQLRNKMSLTKDETDRLKTINQELLETYDHLEWRLDSLGNVIFPNLNKVIEEQRKEVNKLRLDFLELEKDLAFLKLGTLSDAASEEAGTGFIDKLKYDYAFSIDEIELLHKYKEMGMSHFEAEKKAADEIRKKRETEWKRRTDYEKKLIQDSRQEIIDTLKQAELGKFQILNELGLQGGLAVQDYINNFYDGFITDVDISKMDDMEFYAFVTSFNNNMMDALKSWDFNEEDFISIVDKFNEKFKYALTSGKSVGELQSAINEYFKAFEQLGLSEDFAFTQIQDETIYEVAKAIRNLGDEADYVTTKFQNMSNTDFVNILNYIREMNWDLKNNKEEIDGILTLFNELAQMPGFTEKLENLREYLDAGHLNLYNQELRILADEYGLTSEQLSLLLDTHGKYVESLDSEEDILINVLNAQKDYKDNVTELLGYKKQLIESNGLEVDQMLKLIEVYGVTADQFDVVNGLLTVKKDVIDELIEKEGVYLDHTISDEQARIEMIKIRLEAEKELIIAMLKIYKADGEASAELAKHLIAIEQLKGNAKIISAKAAIEAAEAVVNTEIDGAKEVTSAEEEKNKDVVKMRHKRLKKTADMLKDEERANQTFLKGHVDDTEKATNAAILFWENLRDSIVNFFQNLVIGWKLLGDIIKGSIDFSVLGTSGKAGAKSGGGGAGWNLTPRDYSTAPDTSGDITSEFDIGYWEARLETINESLKVLDKLSADLDNYSFDAIRESLEKLGDAGSKAGKDTEKALKDIEKATKDAAKEIDEYTAKLDAWYNVLRQILILEQDLNKVRKERELMTSEDDILGSLEAELLLLRQLEAQQLQRQDLLQKELEKTAILLMAAAGSAVTLSSDLKSLHVNQEEFLALSTGQKQIVDDLIHSFDELSKSLNEAEIAALDAAIAIRQIQLQAADQLIKAIQDALRKQQKLIIAAIDYEIKMTKKAHDEKMKMYDNELKAINKIIDAKIKSLREEWAETDFRSDLDKEQQEKLRLEREISKLSLDDSLEAQAKKAELEQQLADQIAKINKMQTDYERDQRVKELEELKQIYADETEAKKTAEQEKYDALVEQLEEAKKTINYHYNEIYQDEQMWAKLRQDILEGNLDSVGEMVAELEHFFSDVAGGIYDIAQSYGVDLQHLNGLFSEGVQHAMKELGVSWNATTNLMNSIAQAQQRVIAITQALTQTIAAMTAQVLNYIKSIQAAQKAASSTGSTSPTTSTTKDWFSSSGTTSGTTSGTPTQTYVAPTTKTTTTSSTPTPDQIVAARDLGRRHGKEDAQNGTGRNPSKRRPIGYRTEEVTAYNSGYSEAYTQWSGGGLHSGGIAGVIYHDGGIAQESRNQYHGSYSRIPGGANNRLSELINDLFQTKDNEIVAKLLKGEVVINPVQSMDNLQNNIMSFMDKMPQFSGLPNIAREKAAPPAQPVLDIHIDNMIAEKREHIEQVFTEIQRRLNKAGVLG